MTLSFKINEDLTRSLQRLDNAYTNAFGELQSLAPEELDAIHHYARVSMIGSSTRIENAQLTDIEVNWMDTVLTADSKTTAFDNNRKLFENKLSKDRERSIEEVAGCRSMLLIIYEENKDIFPLKESDIRALHYTLISPYRQAIHHAGQYKTQSNSVVEYNHATKQQRVVFQTAEPGPITASAMHELIAWYNENIKLTPWPVAVACEFVYRFLAIHPFQDGNGRLGRGLFLLSLLHAPSTPISYVSRYLAIDRYIERHKEEYYAVLNRCSNGVFSQDPAKYHLHYFVRYMTKIMQEAIEGLSIARKKYKAERALSPIASKVLQCFKQHPEIRLNTSKIIKELSLPRRTIIYSLNTLLREGLLQKYGEGAGTVYQLTF